MPDDLRPRIVIVEDNPSDTFLLVSELEKHSRGGQIEVLEDGERALLFVREYAQRPITHEVCVLLLDMNLPRHDGIEVLNALREEPTPYDLRVIALSGVPTPAEESAAMSMGVRLYRG